MGRGCNDGLRPLLMTLSAEGSAQERSPLAAPAPVPHEFALRKAHIDKVAGQIASKAYREGVSRAAGRYRSALLPDGAAGTVAAGSGVAG